MYSAKQWNTIVLELIIFYSRHTTSSYIFHLLLTRTRILCNIKVIFLIPLNFWRVQLCLSNLPHLFNSLNGFCDSTFLRAFVIKSFIMNVFKNVPSKNRPDLKTIKIQLLILIVLDLCRSCIIANSSQTPRDFMHITNLSCASFIWRSVLVLCKGNTIVEYRRLHLYALSQ